MNLEHYINKIEFNLVSPNCFCSYALKSRLDGVNWKLLVFFSKRVYEGKQTVAFGRRKMKFLEIKMYSDVPEALKSVTAKEVFAIML